MKDSTKKFLLFTLALVGIGAYMNKVKIADMGSRLSTKWTGLHPEMKKRAINVLDKAEIAFKDTPYSVHIFDGKRELSKQREYMAAGTSFINNPLRSYHLWGLAVDFVFKDERGNWTWEPAKDCAFYDFSCKGSDWYWQTLGEIIESEGLKWGGRWKSFDGPHGQLEIFGTTGDLIAQYETPDKFAAVA